MKVAAVFERLVPLVRVSVVDEAFTETCLCDVYISWYTCLSLYEDASAYMSVHASVCVCVFTECALSKVAICYHLAVCQPPTPINPRPCSHTQKLWYLSLMEGKKSHVWLMDGWRCVRESEAVTGWEREGEGEGQHAGRGVGVMQRVYCNC